MIDYQINNLTPTIGAEISGIDLSKDLNSLNLDNFYKNLIDHKVIFFRNQNLKPEDHIAFAKSFGDIEPPHPIYPHVENFPEITLLENDPSNPPDTDEWHTDVTFKTKPPFTSILYSKEIPPSGGDTLWCSLTAIYDDLPENIKSDLENKRAVHDMGAFRNNFSSDDNEEYSKKLNAGFEKFGNAVHPIIKVHPISKKKFLYINPSFTRHIIGLDMTDSNNLLSYLFNFMTKPQYQVRFKWTPNTLALWDNRCTMHYAIGDYLPHRRVMNRITVLNDKREISK